MMVKYLAGFLILSSTYCINFAFDLPRQNYSVDQNTTALVRVVEKCDTNGTIKIDHDLFRGKELLKFNNAHAIDLHYDNFGNLFYVKTGRNEFGFHFDIYVLRANETAPHKVKGMPEGLGYSIAVEKSKNIVYFGTQRGIYKYNYEDISATLCCLPNQQIGMIFVDADGDIYVTELVDGHESLYLLVDNEKVAVRRLNAISDMAIDADNDIYYIKSNSFRVLNADGVTGKKLFDLRYDGKGQINFDRYGRVFVASHKLIYFNKNKIDKTTVVEGVPDDITCIAFDNYGNFVLGANEGLFKYERVNCSMQFDKTTTKPIEIR